MKFTILVYVLLTMFLLNCGTKNEKETTEKVEKTTEKQENTEKNDNEKEEVAENSTVKEENWEGSYEFVKANEYQITLTIKADNTFELEHAVRKGGFKVFGNLSIQDKKADLIFEESAEVSPLDKEYKKGDVFGNISKNGQDLDIDCSIFGERNNLKKVDNFQIIQF